MKNFSVRKEIWIWIIIVLPVAYLLYAWNALPEIVPTHFAANGQPNDWGHKRTLAFIVPGMLLGIYALMLVIPSIDPKKKISAMGNKYFLLKLFLMLFVSVMCFFMIQTAVTGQLRNSNILFLILGGLFTFLGNYMQSIKPNYFIGIRTPWTLEREAIWRKTHLLGGKLYFIAGLLIMILPFILKDYFQHVLLPIIIVASLIPVIYSFILFRQEQAGRL